MAIPVNTYTKHNWVDDSSPDLEAEVLNEIETGIKDNNDAIKAIAAAVVSQIVNDPDKIASMAALYAVNQTLGNLSTTVTNINSNLVVNAFGFTPNTAGITSSDIICRRVGKMCVMNGIFTPNQAGTPLTLGSIDITPVANVTFCITGYEKVASYGTVGTDRIFKCNIPSALVNTPCAINIAFMVE